MKVYILTFDDNKPSNDVLGVFKTFYSLNMWFIKSFAQELEDLMEAESFRKLKAMEVSDGAFLIDCHPDGRYFVDISEVTE